MKHLKHIGLGIGLLFGVFALVDLAGAQSLTDSLQSGRMTVLGVNAATGQIYCLEADGRIRVVEFGNGAVPLVVADGVQKADLSLLNSGDIIKVERKDGRAHRIMVLRPASAELAGPEQ